MAPNETAVACNTAFSWGVNGFHLFEDVVEETGAVDRAGIKRKMAYPTNAACSDAIVIQAESNPKYRFDHINSVPTAIPPSTARSWHNEGI